MSELSSQSQEAITAVETELSNILNKGKRKKEDTEEETTEKTTSDVQHSPKATKTDHKSEQAAPENKTNEAKRSLTESQQISWYFAIDLNDPSNSQNDNSSPPSSQSNEINNVSSRPTMQRSKSLEAIGKNPPSKIIKVCVEKITQVLQMEPVDYKKLKYWLKIAYDVAQQIGKEKDFNEFLKKLHNAHKSKTEFTELITTSFPQASLA